MLVFCIQNSEIAFLTWICVVHFVYVINHDIDKHYVIFLIFDAIFITEVIYFFHRLIHFHIHSRVELVFIDFIYVYYYR